MPEIHYAQPKQEHHITNNNSDMPTIDIIEEIALPNELVIHKKRICITGHTLDECLQCLELTKDTQILKKPSKKFDPMKYKHIG